MGGDVCGWDQAIREKRRGRAYDASAGVILLKFPKAGQKKLKGAAYREFAQGILELDGQKCKLCGRTSLLTVEHFILRSKLRLDTKENCLCLCIFCNQAAKEKRIKYDWDPATRVARRTR